MGMDADMNGDGDSGGDGDGDGDSDGDGDGNGDGNGVLPDPLKKGTSLMKKRKRLNPERRSA